MQFQNMMPMQPNMKAMPKRLDKANPRLPKKSKMNGGAQRQ